MRVAVSDPQQGGENTEAAKRASMTLKTAISSTIVALLTLIAVVIIAVVK